MVKSFNRVDEASEFLIMLRNWLSDRNPAESTPDFAYGDFESVLQFYRNHFGKTGNKEKFYFTSELLDRLQSEGRHIPIREIKKLVFEAQRIAFDIGLASSIQYPKELEDRINYLEGELSRLSSNPALENKISKIEKEVRKLRTDSARTFETSVKEQKDMLKEYKEADKKVFVIMPFAPIFNDVWNGGIERACDTKKFGCLRVDKISLSSWITDDIVNYISMADFVVADITGNNPNVMFELGWALALDKKPIVIREKNDPNKVPFDVKDIRYIPYTNTWSGIEALFRKICEFLQATSETLNEKQTTEKKKKATRSKKKK